MKKVIAGLMSICLIHTVALACDISYKEVTKETFDYIGSASEDLVSVAKGGKYGYINTKGELTVDYIYDFAGTFNEGKAVVRKGVETGFIKKDGSYTKLTGEKTYISAETMFYNGYIYIKTDVYGELFDYNGKRIIFDNIDGKTTVATGSYGEGYFPIASLNKDGDKYTVESCGFADSDGKIIKKFASANSVKSGEDKNIITFLYPLDDGLSAAYFDVFKDGKKTNSYWGFTDKNGEIIIEPKYKTFRYKFNNGRYQAFSDGLVAVQNHNGRFGAINKQGETVIPFNYEALETFNEGISPAKLNGATYYDFIDTKGNRVIDGNKYKIVNASSSNNKLAVIYTEDAKTLIISPYCRDVLVNTSENIENHSYFSGDSSRPFTGYDTSVKNDKKVLQKATVKYDEFILSDDISAWAYPEVKKAIDDGIIPENIQNMFKSNITREDFAVLIMQMLDKKMGLQQELLWDNPFKDTANSDVLRANKLGLINGVGGGLFAPYSNITREDAATILKRAIDILKINYSAGNNTYNDNNKISSYATSAVNAVSDLGIMKGVSGNNFAPKDFYSREQAMITIFRLYNK